MADSERIQNIIDRYFHLNTGNSVEKTASNVGGELVKRASDVNSKLSDIINSAMIGIKVASGLSDEETSILNILRAN